MCATATKSATEPATKTKAKTKSKKPPSAAQAEASRRNAQKSSGPKTDEGKAKSRFNALKHGMTAQSILLPGDDGQAFASRLRYLLDDLQPRNSLEAVVIERLAGDLWKSDRAEGSACGRISFRLRHEPVDQALNDRHEAIELGQHLLWQPAWPLPVGLNEGEAKGALAKFPLTDVPGDPLHPAGLLLNLESTVAGCDWLLARWRDLRFQLENPGSWRMADVWKMVRLLGKTAIQVKDDYQVALLVLASLALEPEPEHSDKPTFAEAVRAMTPNDGLSRVVAGITRLCEPFQQALARMPLDKLAPENQEEARQRLFAVVEQEEGRIGRIRAMLQRIADADLAEAPIRLAFETGTEGDRGRRYILSYERLVNRRIDTFLKVRKASGSGELDLVELEKTLGSEKFAELVADAGITTSQDPGDLRSGDRRGQETRAQHGETCAQHEETVGQQPPEPFATPPPRSARVSDPAETGDRRSPIPEATLDHATAGSMEPRATETFGRIPGRGADQESGDLRSGDGRGRETRAQHGETCAQHEEAVGQQPPDPYPAPRSGSARVSDPAETGDRRSPIPEATLDHATAGSMEPRATETFGRIPGRGADQESGDLRSGDGRGRETRAQHGETRAQHGETRAQHGETRAQHGETRAQHGETCAQHEETVG